MNKPLIIAHRGASELAPENTLAAFQKAFEDGAEGIEFDVRLAKDGIPVVFHDADLLRIAGKDILVEKLLCEDLQKIDVGSWFNLQHPEKFQDKFSNERISTLEQTLDFLKDYKGVIYIELKSETIEIENLSKAVCEIIKNSNLLPQFIVKSFNLDALPIIQKHCPNAKTAALFALEMMILLRKEKRLINIAKELNVDFLSLHFSLATRKLMEKAEKGNLKVTIWTADNPRWVKRSLKLGIEHIITNNPARLLAKRNEILQSH
ncbi:MAG: glycerophosphodiester phosphodiesterase [Aridibacter sp.]